MSQIVQEAVKIEGFAQGTPLAISTIAAQTADLGTQDGIYDLWSDVDCYVKIAVTANDVTTSTGYLLRANNTLAFFVNSGRKIGAITASGTGNLYFHRTE
jgi:hypothetical protein